MHYRVILLTHSDETLSFADSYASTTWENTELCIVNCGPNRTNAQAEAIVVSTGGEAYDAVNASDLTIDTGKVITIPPEFMGEHSDEDGIPDIVEIYGLKPDGTRINSDPGLEDTDGDGLSDSEELGFIALDEFLQSAEDYMQHISYRSDPNNSDTDGDGFDDANDNQPMLLADNRFQLCEQANYLTIPELAWVNERKVASDDDYRSAYNDHDTVERMLSEIDFYGLSGTARLVLTLSVGVLADARFGIVDFGISTFTSKLLCLAFSEGSNIGPLYHAPQALENYFLGLGNSIHYDAADTSELISSSVNNLEHFVYNMTKAMQFGEQIAAEGSYTYFTSIPDANLKTTCFDDKGYNCKFTNKRPDESNSIFLPNRHHNGVYSNHTQVDWHLAIGESLGGIRAEIIRDGNYYTMTYRYCVSDIYEWTPTQISSFDLETGEPIYTKDALGTIFHYFHEIGYAKEFLIDGYFEGTITWEAGAAADDKDVFDQITATMKSTEGSMRWDLSNCIDTFVNRSRADYRALP